MYVCHVCIYIYVYIYTHDALYNWVLNGSPDRRSPRYAASKAGRCKGKLCDHNLRAACAKSRRRIR